MGLYYQFCAQANRSVTRPWIGVIQKTNSSKRTVMTHAVIMAFLSIVSTSLYQRSRENLTFAVVQPFGIVIRTYCPPLPAVVALS